MNTNTCGQREAGCLIPPLLLCLCFWLWLWLWFSLSLSHTSNGEWTFGTTQSLQLTHKTAIIPSTFTNSHQLKLLGLQERATYPVSRSKTAIFPFLSHGSRQNRAESHTPDLSASQDGPKHQGPRRRPGGTAQTVKTLSASPWAILNLRKLWSSLGARICPAVVTNVDPKLVSFLVLSLPILPTKPLLVVTLLTWKRLASSPVRLTHSGKQAEWQWLFPCVLQMSSAC